MRFVQRHRHNSHGQAPGADEDPLAGLANLFDVSVAFIVALLIALFTFFSTTELLDPGSNVTLVKKREDGTMEIITKQGQEIKVQKVTDRTMSGQGKRLGIAYELPSGQIVYVPEDAAPSQGAR